MNLLRKSIPFLAASLSKTRHIFDNNVLQNARLTFINTTPHGESRGNYVGSADLTIGAIFKKWRHKFETRSISEPVESVEWILSHALGTTRVSDIYKLKETVLSIDKIKEIDSLCAERLKSIPIQYVLGEWSFRFLTLKMSPPVFIPRPETEQLVDIISPEIIRNKNTHILDLCCGSGAIALSLLHEHPLIIATGVDQSKAACQLTKENAQKNGLNNRIRVIQSQLDQWQCEDRFDIIVSNPPYVFREDLVNLQVEIKLYEDLGALDGGEMGFDVIKTILEVSSRWLNEKGKLFLEVEPRHPRLLRDYLLKNNSLGLNHVETYSDFSGKDRFVEIIKIRK